MFDFSINCKSCSKSFEPDIYPVTEEEDKYCDNCTPVEISNDIMKGWDD